MDWFLRVSLFVFGAIIGSFITAYSHRVCKNEEQGTSESVLEPKRSYCPSCKAQIAWYDNVPLLGYLILKGKCRNCKVSIGFSYFAIELFCALGTAVLFDYTFIQLGQPMFAAITLVFFWAMLALSVIDIRVMIIPDEISIGGIPVGIAASALYPALQDPLAFVPGLRALPLAAQAAVASVFGMLIGGGLLLGIGILGTWAFKKEAMGGGDIKLMATFGAFLGWKAVFVVLFLASLLGCAVALGAVAMRRREFAEHIPFGPYLAVAALLALLFQDQILHWFLGFYM